MKIFSLFSGIGGIEYGFHHQGFETISFCEINPYAAKVLATRFPGVPLNEDVTKLKSFDGAEIVTAGFPCQDLSLAGGKAGIAGSRSGLVGEIFRILKSTKKSARPQHLVFENVAYMVSLGRGAALRYIISELEALGYSWAYRVVDARAFGVPQRRHRLVMIASLEVDPQAILFPKDYGRCPVDDSLADELIREDRWYGFYWTEGKRGLGWAESSVPPVKGGSTIGIPSPPAVWNPKSRAFGTITIRDAERLQGFPAGWTDVFDGVKKDEKSRWTLVGNAVCTGMSAWVASRLRASSTDIECDFFPIASSGSLPEAAFGRKGEVFKVSASKYPQKSSFKHLHKFLVDPLKPLSLRAISGYHSRVMQCSCTPPRQFLKDIEYYISRA